MVRYFWAMGNGNRVMNSKEDDMAKVLVSYYSRSGNTRRMAEKLHDGLASVDGVSVTLKKIEETTINDLLEFEGIVIGSPTYFGVMAAEVKELIDESVKHFGKLVGKVGGAFTSSGGIGGGNETTNLSLLQALLIHGMVVQGVQKGSHYGPVSVGAPDENAQDECVRYGKQVGELSVKLFGS
jgi:NAD(P)H dehydrogenase (quinone)